MDLFIANHIEPDGSYDGKLFETYGPGEAFVKAQPEGRIATLVEGDEGSIHICHGYHYVNRLGYFVSKDTLPEFGSLCVLEEGDDDGE